MTFNFATFESIINLFVPTIVAAIVPGGAALGPLVASSIVAVEGIFGSGTGLTQKKPAVLAAVADGIGVLNAAKGAVVLDPAVTAQQVGAAIDLGVGIANDIQKLQAPAAAA